MSPPHNQLSLQGRTLSLQPKVMAVLCYLARHSDRVVSNDELLDHVWQGRVVTHASVQKSMNTLRNALAELAGEREFVAHFSKRGYQLVVPVRFEQSVPARFEHAAAVEVHGVTSAAEPTPSRIKHRMRHIAIWLALPLVIGSMGMLAWLALQNDTGSRLQPLVKQHTTVFTGLIPLSQPGQRERRAEPHPDGKRMAYIRDLATGEGHESQILIRGPDGSDWLLASVEGSWVDLAWSPSGRNLVATEIRRAEGLPRTPDYFEQPNNLYSFHIFTLDFRGERLLEKNLLSQWQGLVASVTWWDENTLEFVASLGPGSTNERYRYWIAEQQLSALNPLSSGFTPLKSVVHDKRTAVISRRRNAVQLEFLDAEQEVLATVALPSATLDISWIPDGTGLLVLDKSGLGLYTLDRYGQIAPVRLPGGDARAFSHPRYSRDGTAIVLTTFKDDKNLSLRGGDGSYQLIAGNGGAQSLSRFLFEDGAVIFAADNHGEHSLWRWHKGHKELLQVVENPLEDLLVAADGNALVYRSGGTIWQWDLRTQKSSTLWKKAGAVEPVFYAAGSNELLFIRRSGEARNVWLRDLKTQEERQITFGTVGTVMASDDKLYFQYSDQPGLWRLDQGKPNPVQISKQLPKNSKLLHVTDATAFFVAGGPCHETGLQSLDLLTDVLSMENVLSTRDIQSVRDGRASTDVISQDYHPVFGVLQTECKPTESQLIQYVSAPE